MIFLSLRVTADAEGGLKGPAQLRQSLRGLGGVSHQQASAGIYRRIACHYYRTSPIASTIPLYLCLNLSDKLTWAHIQRIGNFPKSLKICLLVTILNHCQMSAGNSRKAAQDILRYALLIAKAANCSSNRIIVELHRPTPLSQQIVYEKTEK
ncbi:hypothetical protein AALA99_14160 [Anaerotruncus colihominis]